MLVAVRLWFNCLHCFQLADLFPNSGRVRAGLAGFPGFHHSMVRRCSLHTLNLRVGQQVIGSVMQELLDEGAFQNREQAYGLFKQWLKENKIQCSQPLFPNSTWSNQESTAASMTCKGYNSRVITAWLADVCMGFSQTQHQIVRSACVYELNRFYGLMESNPRCLEDSAAKAMKQCMDSFIKAFRILCKLAIASKRLRWTCKPKLHQAEHLGLQCLLEKLNPRFHHTFCDEDFMGQIRRLAISTHVSTMTLRSLQRFVLRLELRWSSRSDLISVADFELAGMEARAVACLGVWAHVCARCSHSWI